MLGEGENWRLAIEKQMCTKPYYAVVFHSRRQTNQEETKWLMLDRHTWMMSMSRMFWCCPVLPPDEGECWEEPPTDAVAVTTVVAGVVAAAAARGMGDASWSVCTTHWSPG